MAQLAQRSLSSSAQNHLDDTNRLYEKANYVFDVTDFGAVGDGTTDDLASIQAAITAAQGGTVTVGVPGGTILFPPGEYLISDTIVFSRFSGTIQGSGRGQSPAYSPQPGNGSVIRWNGDAASPMVDVRDSRHISFFDLRFEGKIGTKPTYGIEFISAGGSTGTNEIMTVQRCYFGEYPWCTQGTASGDLASGIGFTGTNANNDQYWIKDCEFSSCSSYGVYFPNSQSVWGSVKNCYFHSCGTAVASAASITVDDCGFDSSVVMDLQVLSTASMLVKGFWSENTEQLAEVAPSANLHIKGGTCQVGDVQTGGGVLIDAFPSDAQNITLEDIKFAEMTTPASALIEIGPENPYVGQHTLTVRNCHNIVPAQLDLTGSYWATSPESMGIIEWVSHDDTDLYQFRNMMATNSGRTALDTDAWDTPDQNSLKAGFYGTTPIVQQTGVAVTEAGIHAALVALGLITA